MKKFLVLVAGVAMFAAPAVYGQERPLRLFYSSAGLSNPANTNSAAGDPTADLGVNPVRSANPGEAVRLYVWAQIAPPGTPNNVTYNGVSFTNNLTIAGGGAATISGFNFWNYTNGDLGNGAGRWQNFSQSAAGSTNNIAFAGAAVTAGIGVTNSNAANTNDGQHRRFATNGTTRIDATLLGWVEVTGTAAGQSLELRFAVGQSGIAQSGDTNGPNRVYMGWGDEASAPLGNGFGASTPGADAIINVIPEPASLMLLGLAGLALRRR
jgi:hypothetical protein